MTDSPGTGWTRCQYFSFHDVPRALVLHHLGRTLLLHSPFDEDLDDYTPSYFVWELQPMNPQDTLGVSWDQIESRKLRQLDGLPVAALEFWPKRDRIGERFYAWYRFKSEDSHTPRGGSAA